MTWYYEYTESPNISTKKPIRINELNEVSGYNNNI